MSETAAAEPGRMLSGSLLIYCRSSVVLSLLVFSGIAALLYSDLYVHLIRQPSDAFLAARVVPGTLLALLVLACAGLVGQVKPALERIALGLLSLDLLVLFLRRRASDHSDAYLALCVVSLLLDLGLLAAVVAFYRKYPNVLKALRGEGAGGR